MKFYIWNFSCKWKKSYAEL